MLNSPKVIGWADAAAQKLKKFDSETEKIQQAFKMTLGRLPTTKEEAAATSFMTKFKKTEGRNVGGGFRPGVRPGARTPDVDAMAWSALVQGLFATSEFRYLD
jgi:hypothetical protein